MDSPLAGSQNRIAGYQNRIRFLYTFSSLPEKNDVTTDNPLKIPDIAIKILSGCYKLKNKDVENFFHLFKEKEVNLIVEKLSKISDDKVFKEFQSICYKILSERYDIQIENIINFDEVMENTILGINRFQKAKYKEFIEFFETKRLEYEYFSLIDNSAFILFPKLKSQIFLNLRDSRNNRDGPEELDQEKKYLNQLKLKLHPLISKILCIAFLQATHSPVPGNSRLIFLSECFSYSDEDIENLYSLFISVKDHWDDDSSQPQFFSMIYYLWKQLRSMNISLDLLTNLNRTLIESLFGMFVVIYEENGEINQAITNGFKIKNIHEYNSFSNCIEKSSNFQEFICRMLTNVEFIDLFHSYKINYPENIHEHYIVRKDGWVAGRYPGEQKKYGELMHHAVVFSADALKQNLLNFEQLLAFLCYCRSYIGKEQGQQTTKIVGLPRASELYTGFDGAYKNLGERILKKVKIWVEESHPNIRILDVNKWQVIEKIGSKTASLSIFEVDKLIHTSSEEIACGMDHVADLYNKALEEKSSDKLLDKLGAIFWWICQIKPFYLGDPSIAELLIRSVWLYKTGQNLPPWKKGLIPWESTVDEPSVDTYAQNFSKLLDYEYASKKKSTS